MDFVKKTVGEEIRITTTDGRICTGILTCFDANGNFLFREVSECVLIDVSRARSIRNSMIPFKLVSKIEVQA